jgi:lysophospholipase L1-like esterase
MKIRKFTSILSITCLVVTSLTAQVQSGDLVAIVGDSITAQKMYSRYVAEYLLMCQPETAVESIQYGWGGDFAGALLRRLDHDIISFQPDVVTLFYGMNDGRYKPENAELLNAYRKSMTTAVQKLKAAGTREIYLASPGVVDPASFNKASVSAEDYNEALKAIGQVAQEIAKSEGIHYVDLHQMMDYGMTAAKAHFGDDYKLAPDGIHPYQGGHLLIAMAFLKGIGCDGQIGRIEVDYTQGQAECDPGQRVVTFADGALQLESSRYPFVLEVDGTDRDAATMGDLLGFHQAFNRYLLVVKHAPSKLRVSWGDESRVYTAEELGNGVNLAADFAENPFVKPFKEVARAIQVQQQFESYGIRHLLNSVPIWEREVSDIDPDLAEHLRDVIVQKSKDLREQSLAKVRPIQHTIRMEPIL